MATETPGRGSSRAGSASVRRGVGPMTGNRTGVRVSTLFATPVVLGKLDGAAELNAALERQILSKREEDRGLKLSNRGGWQSTHDFVRWSGEAGQAVID